MMRLGFLGTGWIGRNRMEAMLATRQATAVAICDPNPDMSQQAHAAAPTALVVETLDSMLSLDLDGVVIATPSALHAEQSIEALEAGVAVFCQKPLGRNAHEVRAVVDAARRADRLLGVDLSYRHTAAMRAIRDRVQSGELGKLFAADLTFHNAYGPGASWFWDPALSGGGCLIDLGVHLVDLALWLSDFPAVEDAGGALFRNGRPPTPDEVEDFASGWLQLGNGMRVSIACSWNLSAGQDAVIGTALYGTEGSAELRNQKGSFFDFAAEAFHGRDRALIASPPDEWGGRAAAEWVQLLADGERFEASTSGLVATAEALDAIYRSAGRGLASDRRHDAVEELAEASA